jgi:hypothetical protein
VTVHTDDTREELAEFLRNQCQRAKREFPKVGSAEQPTAWDKRHATINDMLDDLEMCTQ